MGWSSSGATAKEGGGTGSMQATLNVTTNGSVGGVATLASVASGRRHTSWPRDWSSDVCASDLGNNSHGDSNLTVTAVQDTSIEGTESFASQTLTVTGAATAGGSDRKSVV